MLFLSISDVISEENVNLSDFTYQSVSNERKMNVDLVWSSRLDLKLFNMGNQKIDSSNKT